MATWRLTRTRSRGQHIAKGLPSTAYQPIVKGFIHSSNKRPGVLSRAGEEAQLCHQAPLLFPLFHFAMMGGQPLSSCLLPHGDKMAAASLCACSYHKEKGGRDKGSEVCPF